MTPEQTEAYIDRQLQRVGSTAKIFDPEAKRLIHDYSSGFPRQINNVATACLIHAAAKDTQKVSEQLVAEISQELTRI